MLRRRRGRPVARRPAPSSRCDGATLVYNFLGVSKTADGETSANLAKSTRVYAKQGGKWLLVHANFAPVGADD